MTAGIGDYGTGRRTNQVARCGSETRRYDLDVLGQQGLLQPHMSEAAPTREYQGTGVACAWLQ